MIVMHTFNFTVYKIMLKRKRKYLQPFKNNAVSVSHRCFGVFSVWSSVTKEGTGKSQRAKQQSGFRFWTGSSTRLWSCTSYFKMASSVDNLLVRRDDFEDWHFGHFGRQKSKTGAIFGCSITVGKFQIVISQYRTELIGCSSNTIRNLGTLVNHLHNWCRCLLTWNSVAQATINQESEEQFLMEVWEKLLYLGVQASPDNSLCFLAALCFSSRRCFSLAEASICKINSGNCKKNEFPRHWKEKTEQNIFKWSFNP